MKKILSLLLILVLAAGLFACGNEHYLGALYTTRILALKGPTGMGMAKLFNESKYDITLSGAPTDVTSEIIAGRYDLAAVPTNLAATLYNKTEGKLKVVALNTLGVLYVLENGNTVNSIGDLKGKTIGASGEGSTPEYVLNYILAKNGLEVGKDVNVVYYAEHSELMTEMVTGKVNIAILPQPNVSTAMAKNTDIRIALDLTAEWNKVSPESELTMGCIVANVDYIENHPKELEAFLDDYKKSTSYVNENPNEASKIIAEQGIIPSEAIAKNAIPYCNICSITGDEMKTILSGFLQVLYDANPKSVGGKMPDEEFYLK